MGIGAILEGWGSSEVELTTRSELPAKVRAYYNLYNIDGHVYLVGSIGLSFLLGS